MARVRGDGARKRSVAACLRCRNSKLKCSGTQPCERCDLRSKDCVYDNKERRVTVTKSYLDSLRAAAAGGVPPNDEFENVEILQSPTRTHDPDATQAATAPNIDEPAETPASVIVQEPNNVSPVWFENRPTQRRRWLYLGASSLMAFNLRAAAMLRERIDGSEMEDPHAFRLDGDAYDIPWSKHGVTDSPDLGSLPSLDYAIYLTNTVKFHMNSMFRLFDDDDFLRNLHEFYADASAKVQQSRLWFVQYLVVMALGQGFLQHRGMSVDRFPGANYFSRALSLLPETHVLYEDSVLATEALALIALYFYCLDMKQSAYSYIGHAQRIAIFEGMHTRLADSKDHIGEHLAERCTNIFWTIYILDRTLSSTIGVPPSLHDADIRNVLPSPDSAPQRLAVLSLHVKFSRLISRILSELCETNGSLETSYLAKVQSTLRKTAGLADELEGMINNKFKNSIDSMPKSAIQLRLMYHQCTILAIRPLLLSLLSSFMRSKSKAANFFASLPTSIHDLLEACQRAAVKTINILDILRHRYMLDIFLPFDLEYLSAAASVLIVLEDLLKFKRSDKLSKRLSMQLLDSLVKRGSVPARFRQEELVNISDLSRKFWRQRHEDDHGQQLPGTDENAAQNSQTVGPFTFGTSIDDLNMIDPSLAAGNSRMAPPLPSVATSTPDLGSDIFNDSRYNEPLNDEMIQYFELAQEDILEIADRLDISTALPDTLDFSEVTEDWLWDVAGHNF